MGRKRRLQRIYHLKITGTYQPQYWLHLEMNAAAPLLALDAFLRRIWLECCDRCAAGEDGELDEMCLPLVNSP